MISAYLHDVIIIFAAAVVIIAIGNRLKIPGIVGFIITGIVIGPYGLGLINDSNMVDALAEIGIIFLLFTIGMQFSFRKLYEMKKIVVIGGTLQVLVTIAATMAIMHFFGVPVNQAVFLGFLVCHSSTAITLKIYQDRAEIDSPQARVTLGISIFQDIVTIPMLISLPILAGQTADITSALFNLSVTFAILLAFVFAISVFAIPRFMNGITGTRNPELFLLSIILICFVVTFITSSIGLSVALGAFLAGLTLSESEYFHQAFASILPFRDIFTCFFFISIGMLLDLWFMIDNPFLIIFLTLGVLALKTVIAGGASLAIGHSLRTSVLAGLALCNIGEFAFILSIPGTELGLFSPVGEQIFLAVAVLSMSLTPVAIIAGPRVADFCCRMPAAARFNGRVHDNPGQVVPSLKDHVVIVGYGLNGKNIARTAKSTGIPYVIIDLNPDTVHREREKGEPIFFGDATNESILEHASIGQARVLVIVINDPPSSRVITRLAREMNPHIFIIVRTRFVTEVKTLRELGADEVIPEEFETSIEIFTRVLKKYLVPKTTIEGFVQDIRAGTYTMFRDPDSDRAGLADLSMNLPDTDICSLKVHPSSEVTGKSLAGLNVRHDYGISVLAIKRKGEVVPNPPADYLLETGDELVVLGKSADIARLGRVLHPEVKEEKR